MRSVAIVLLAVVSFGCRGTIVRPDHPAPGSHGEDGASEDGNPDDAGEDEAGDDGKDPVGDPTNSGCVSDRVEAPAGDGCQCEFDDCEATSLSCECDLACYGGGCLIGTDAEGNGTSRDGFLGDCDLSCTPENDLSQEMTCSASDCEITPSVVDINPTAPPSPPSVSSFEAERAVQDVDVTFVVDNSGSMVDNQMASACAMESFFDAASANGGSYRTGVLTTDMLGDQSAPGGTYDSVGNFVAPPELVQMDGACNTVVACEANCEATVTEICEVQLGGDYVANDEPGSEALLQQLIVQGDDGSAKEGGLEQAFQLYAEQERQATFDYDSPKETVVISDEDAAAYYPVAGRGEVPWLCPFDSVDRHTESIPSFDPPTPVNTDASCIDDLIDFYVYYFTSRNIIVHGLLYTDDCAAGSTEKAGVVYQAVIEATGGHVESICHCEDFGAFFANVGESTSTLSTELCFAGSLPDPSTIQVVFVDTDELVPASATDGWTLEPDLNCIVMNGSWAQRYGTFRIEYIDPDAPPPPPENPVACLEPGLDPLLDTIRVFCAGVEVPASTTDGYSFDPVTDCFEFHGAYADVDGATCSVEYL